MDNPANCRANTCQNAQQWAALVNTKREPRCQSRTCRSCRRRRVKPTGKLPSQRASGRAKAGQQCPEKARPEEGGQQCTHPWRRRACGGDGTFETGRAWRPTKVVKQGQNSRPLRGRKATRRQTIRMSDLSTRMVGSWPTMVITGNGESGLDSGEGA